MTTIVNKRGAWLNQYAVPSDEFFLARAKEVDYVVIKYGFQHFEKLCFRNEIPWLAELMAEDFPGDQKAWLEPLKYAIRLAAQAVQPGCVGAVLNLEEADGGWHLDRDGLATRTLIAEFRKYAPNMPLYASLDTRGNRPNYAYQQACAELCDGVMPMVYPQAFGQSATQALLATITPLVQGKWRGKAIIPTLQTYGPIEVASVQALGNICNLMNQAGYCAGVNAYTLGHASAGQWEAFLDSSDWADGLTPVTEPDPREALITLGGVWKRQWTEIAERGTVEEAVALADMWRRLVGGK